MKFKEVEERKEFCKKYSIKTQGGIRISKKYPFIFLVYNPCSNYNDKLKADKDGVFSEVNYIATSNNDENWNLKNHARLKGAYHSVFLLQSASGTFRCLGEYEVKNTNINERGYIESFDLQLIGKNGLDDEIVYFVEKDNPIELSKLTDRSDVIEGVYPEEEVISYDGVNQAVQEGMYLDYSFRPINLDRIINTRELNREGELLSLNFMMREGSSLAERKVAQHLYLLNETNKEIQLMYLSEETEAVPVTKVEKAFLYTVNVGCGLTNFLVKKTRDTVSVWAIDWGSGKNYTTESELHISRCIVDIKNTFFAGADFTLEKLFISHADSDHYNRIDTSLINTDTEVWVSGYHFVAGNFLNKLNQIRLAGAKFRNPICASSNSEINVLHPIWPIVYGAPALIGAGFYIAVKKNNVSPVIKINVEESTCVFTGDIMEDGWQWFASTSACTGIDCDVYLHTHHGSINGFITNIPAAGNCEYDTVTSSIDILSTRDNAYPGSIPSVAIQSRTEYTTTKSTQLAPNELVYYKTDLFTKTINPIY